MQLWCGESMHYVSMCMIQFRAEPWKPLCSMFVVSNIHWWLSLFLQSASFVICCLRFKGNERMGDFNLSERNLYSCRLVSLHQASRKYTFWVCVLAWWGRLLTGTFLEHECKKKICQSWVCLWIAETKSLKNAIHTVWLYISKGSKVTVHSRVDFKMHFTSLTCLRKCEKLSRCHWDCGFSVNQSFCQIFQHLWIPTILIVLSYVSQLLKWSPDFLFLAPSLGWHVLF